MGLIGNTTTYEKTSDRTSFTANGTQGQFGIQYSGRMFRST